ncbi:MAG: hypothetical protein IZT59_01750 [Verrucomicrobia bacterium]|jgi:hypothetical protein|nr:hypothetical protein [Verrucomicrobiota bacterium]
MLRIDPQAVRAACLERLRDFVKSIDGACGKMRASIPRPLCKIPSCVTSPGGEDELLRS